MYYIIITHTVYSDRTLQDGAKILYGLILSLSEKTGYCWADNNYLIQQLDISERTLQNYLKALKDKQYIYVELIKNSIRRITTQDTRVGITKSKKAVKTQKNDLRRHALEPEWLQSYIDDEIATMQG